jgi:hypothetical protein
MIVYSYNLNIQKPQDAHVMSELLDFYLAEVIAMNIALTEQFKERGMDVGDVFPTGTAKELLGKLRDAEKGYNA